MKKLIKTKEEIELKEILGVKCNTLDRLISWAIKKYKVETTVHEYILIHRKQVREEKRKTAREWGMSIREYEILKTKADKILSSFTTGHSMGCYRGLRLNNKTFTINNILHTYSNSCTWKETYGDIVINLTKKELREIENIEGVWTIRKGKEAIILDGIGHKNRFEVVKKHCWIAGSSHSEISYIDALRLEALKRKDVMVNKMFVSKEDVHRFTGACYPGIKAFCDRNNLNVENGYRVDYLLSLQDTYGDIYLRKFVK